MSLREVLALRDSDPWFWGRLLDTLMSDVHRLRREQKLALGGPEMLLVPWDSDAGVLAALLWPTRVLLTEQRGVLGLTLRWTYPTGYGHAPLREAVVPCCFGVVK